MWGGEITIKIIQLGNLRKGTQKFNNPQTGRVYSIDGIAPAINTCQGGESSTKGGNQDNT